VGDGAGVGAGVGAGAGAGAGWAHPIKIRPLSKIIDKITSNSFFIVYFSSFTESKQNVFYLIIWR
jgi:hypothetical protein